LKKLVESCLDLKKTYHPMINVWYVQEIKFNKNMIISYVDILKNSKILYTQQHEGFKLYHRFLQILWIFNIS
jgi:hypothetical protein